MFSSPCSLRSTQCAALIALAAAAGISRFEPAHAKPNAPNPIVGTRTFAVVTSVSRAQFYFAAIQALAPRFRVSHPTFDFERADATGRSHLEMFALAPVASWPPAAASPAPPLNFGAPTVSALSARNHSFPYAVGPPPRGIHCKLRAAGIEVPGGSPVRRGQVSRIAPFSFLIFQARAPRATDCGPRSAESLPAPNSALRGEPESLPRHVRPPARFAAPARNGTALFSP